MVNFVKIMQNNMFTVFRRVKSIWQECTPTCIFVQMIKPEVQNDSGSCSDSQNKLSESLDWSPGIYTPRSMIFIDLAVHPTYLDTQLSHLNLIQYRLL